jgi:tetratricopeptide (TPR) repeat protein/predicted Ser/Thr protein kinase
MSSRPGPDTQRWRQVDDLFHAAVACDRLERASLLARGCGDDSALRVEVESLLAAHERASSFIELPAFEVAPRRTAEIAPPFDAGRRIGRYTLRGVLGRGGMGVVYEAEQDNPQRIVALKVMRALPYLDELTPRLFKREGQALARLEHPGIAAIHEAGVTDDGWHYFAMERVEGVPLTQFAQDRKLSIRARLELFARVCDAVHYAHQRGVIHRDLKPSNILVTEAAQPKVLDFGLARIVDAGADQTWSTHSGAFQGTLAYASPEQAGGRVDQIDVRIDVYSLGVVLFELLTGQRPYELGGLPLPQAARLICEQPPKAAGALDRACRGDLETIVAKALEKEAPRRYQTVGELAADLGRFMRHEPISARPPSTMYLFRKFGRRHRAGLAASVLTAAALLTATIVSTVFALGESEQRALADERAHVALNEKARAKQVLEVLTQMLEGVRADVALGRDTTVLKGLLDQTAQRVLDGEFATLPAVELDLSIVMAKSYDAIGAAATGEPIAERALALAETLHADDDLARAQGMLAKVWQSLGRLAEAETLFERTLALRRRLFSGDSRETARTLVALASVRRQLGRPAEAEPLADEALAMRRRLFPSDHPDVADALNEVAGVRQDLGRWEEAERVYTEALEMYRRCFTGDHPRVGRAVNNLALARKRLGRLAEAEALYDQALAMTQRLHAGDHPDLAVSLNNLAEVRAQMGRPAEALPLFEQALVMKRRLFTGDHPSVASGTVGLASCLADLHREAEAEPLHEEALAMYRRLFPGDHPQVARCLNNLANTRQRLGRLAEAAPLFDDALAMMRRLHDGDHPQVASALSNFAFVLARLDRAAEAEALYDEALSMRRRLFTNDHPDVLKSLDYLAAIRTKLANYAGAEPLLEEAVAMCERLSKAESADLAWLVYRLSKSKRALDKTQEADDLLVRARDMAVRVYPDGHARRTEIESAAARVLPEDR